MRTRLTGPPTAFLGEREVRVAATMPSLVGVLPAAFAVSELIVVVSCAAVDVHAFATLKPAVGLPGSPWKVVIPTRWPAAPMPPLS